MKLGTFLPNKSPKENHLRGEWEEDDLVVVLGFKGSGWSWLISQKAEHHGTRSLWQTNSIPLLLNRKQRECEKKETHYSPLSYKFINGRIHSWSQTPHDLCAGPFLNTDALEIKSSAQELLGGVFQAQAITDSKWMHRSQWPSFLNLPTPNL